MSEKKHMFNCVRCELFKCLNLFEKSKDSIDAGNELYVYSILGKKIKEKLDLTAYVCVNGHFLNASCFLTVPIYTDYKGSYLSDILIQATRDFKGSMFLAFSGHYRQAMQVLRCAFETIISGVYFQSDLVSLKEKKVDTKHLSRLERRFNEWKKEGRGDIHKTIETLRRINFLSVEEEDHWHELYRLLSKFIHTPEEFVTYVKHAGERKLKGDIVCPAATYFNEEQLIEWSDCFQRVFAILLKTIAEFHPKVFNTESGKLALIRHIEPQLKDFGEKIKVCEEIRQILSTI